MQSNAEEQQQRFGFSANQFTQTKTETRLNYVGRLAEFQARGSDIYWPGLSNQSR